MNRLLFLFLSTFILTNLPGQITHLSIGSKTSGICFGNSRVYNGLRFNLRDRNVKHINGINISFLTKSELSNGISFGIIVSTDSISNGIKIGGLAVNTPGHQNGIALSCIAIVGNKYNGIGLSGYIVADTLNGLFASWIGQGIIMADVKDSIKVIKGFTLGLVGNCAIEIKGFALGLGANIAEKQEGVSVAILNSAENLRGIQFGLINHAGNNPRLLRWVPLVNFNFRKNEGKEKH